MGAKGTDEAQSLEEVSGALTGSWPLAEAVRHEEVSSRLLSSQGSRGEGRQQVFSVPGLCPTSVGSCSDPAAKTTVAWAFARVQDSFF